MCLTDASLAGRSSRIRVAIWRRFRKRNLKHAKEYSTQQRRGPLSHCGFWGPGSNGTANRLKPLASPVAVRAFHAGIALREAVTVIRVAGDVVEQLVHGFIKVFVALIGHLEAASENGK